MSRASAGKLHGATTRFVDALPSVGSAWLRKFIFRTVTHSAFWLALVEKPGYNHGDVKMSKTRTVKLTDAEINAVMSVALNGVSWDAILSFCLSNAEASRVEAAFERAMTKLAQARSPGRGRRMQEDAL